MKTAKTMKKRVAAVALIIAWGALPARGQAKTHNEVSVRVGNAFVLDEGMDALSEDDRLVQVEVLYARALWSLPLGDLWAEASWTSGRLESSLFGRQFDTSAFLHSFTVGARYAVPVLSWLIPHLRIGAGLGVGHFEIASGSSAGPAANFEAGRSTAFGLAGYALAGVEVLLPTVALRRGESRISFGLVIEGGLNFGTNLSVDASPERDEDKLLIPLGGTALGSFNPMGPVFRVGGVVRF